MATTRMDPLAKRNGDGRIVRVSQVYDTVPRYLTDKPSPTKFAALLKSVDAGDLAALCELQLEMERKSDQYKGLVDTRRGALTSLDWCIEADEDADNPDFAAEVADYCSHQLAGIRKWSEVLCHLSQAIGPNLAAVELIWSKAEIVDFEVVPCTRFVAHPYLTTGVAIRTDDEYMGIPLDSFPGKFMVYIPELSGGFPFRSTITHASVGAYLMIHFSRADWMAFSEWYGSPSRIGTYDDTTIDADRTTVQDMLDKGGTDASIMLPKGISVDYKQAAGTGETYERQLAHADAKLSILWLGQTLTTELTKGAGSRAAAEVHRDVQNDKLRNDIANEAACIREQLLRLMCAYKWPGKEVPVPYFVRVVESSRDVEAERMDLDQLRMAKELELRLDDGVAYAKLHLPVPTTPEPRADNVAQAVAATINELTLGIERAARGGDLALVNMLRKRIADLLGETLPDLTELPVVGPLPGRPKMEETNAADPNALPPDGDAGEEDGADKKE